MLRFLAAEYPPLRTEARSRQLAAGGLSSLETDLFRGAPKDARSEALAFLRAIDKRRVARAVHTTPPTSRPVFDPLAEEYGVPQGPWRGQVRRYVTPAPL